MKLYAELIRRNVIRVGIAYAVASWVILQIVDVISPILELPAWAPKLIFVILAIGLIPTLIFAWAYELTPEGVKKESEIDRSRSISHQTGRKLNYVIIATLVVAVALLLVDRQYSAPADATATAAAADPDIAQSIAVLPFVNMSSDPEQEFFSDGITEEILNSLASVRQLKVAGRTSSFAFKGQNDDLRRIGDALGVNHILEGSVRKAGDQVRITAQLIRVDNGFHVWSETYDRELTDVFEIQDDIAREILQQLKSRLLAGVDTVDSARRTSPVVYELYLRAKQRLYTREGPEIEIGLQELDDAIRLDPEYSPAYAQRAIATMLLSNQQYGSIPDDEANRRAKRFIDESLKLDDNNAEAWAALGLYHSNVPGELENAVDPLMKALSINPNLIDASNWLNITLQGLGDFKGALEILEDIAERDPLYRPAFSNAMMLFNAFGAPQKAERMLKRMETFDPDSPDLFSARGVNAMYSGRSGEGLLQMEKRRDLGDMSGVAKIFLSVGLISTMQWERAVNEGSEFFRPDALYELGRKDEAFDLAYEHAKVGYPETLFYLFTREARSEDLVDYLEERWPNLAAFADEVRGDHNGYDVMANVALAYSQLENQARFDEAMGYLERHHASIREQGIDNLVFSRNLGIEAMLRGDVDAAFAHLQDAADRGWKSGGPLAEVEPALAPLTADPRFLELETRMLANLNRDRAIVGLPPMNADYVPEVLAN